MKIYSSTGTWLTHPSLPDLPWDNERTDVHGITSAAHSGLATTLKCACGHEASGATPEDAFADMAAHAHGAENAPGCRGCGWDDHPEQLFGDDRTGWFCTPCLLDDLAATTVGR